jgi:hypothetical protein
MLLLLLTVLPLQQLKPGSGGRGGGGGGGGAQHRRKWSVWIYSEQPVSVYCMHTVCCTRYDETRYSTCVQVCD